MATIATTDDAGRAPAAPPRRRRWLRRLAFAVILLGLLVIFHAPLLRWVALGLVTTGSDAPADAVVVMGGYGPFTAIPIDEAARRYQDKLAASVLLVEDRSGRVARLGIVPTLESVLRRELATRDVPAEAISVLVVTTPGDREPIRRLGTWLADHPDLRVTLFCDELSSRCMAAMVRQTLPPAQAQRVALQPLPDRRFTTDNWWRSRQGIVAVFSEYASLGFVLAIGEEEYPPEWDPDQYEQTLSRR